MGKLVADHVFERLRDWKVKRIFGYPGDGINGLVGALDRAQDEFEFVQVRHEEMAAFMACGHAKFTGELGICLATSGPGAIHLLNGLYDAKMDHQPVVAIVGQQKRSSLGSGYQQEVDLQVLFQDVAEYVETCMDPAQVRHLVDRACRIALGRKGVSVLIFPNDVQTLDAVEAPPREHGSVFSSAGYERPRMLPQESELQHAAEILNSGKKVAILIGQGAAGAEAEVIEAAERLGAGVAKALLGRAVVPDALPFVTGPIGLLGSRPSYELMQGCDTLLMVGTSFPYAEWLPKEGQARCVEIDLDPGRIGMRYPAESLLVGDAKDTLAALLPLLARKQDRSWREKVEGWVGEWQQLLETRALQEADPLNPQRVAFELNKQLPDGAIISADSGSSTTWFARQLQLREGMMASLSGNLASMGPGVPYAIAAKFAYPERPVIAFAGDGAMQMNGLAELITVKRYWRDWADPTFVVCVFNNQDLNQVTWEQRVMEGDPKYMGSQWLPDVPYARFAELLGFEGLTCDRPDDLEQMWQHALAAGRPCLLEVKVSAEVPPLPPHVTVAQGKKMAEALLSDPERGGVIRQTLKGKLPEFVR